MVSTRGTGEADWVRNAEIPESSSATVSSHSSLSVLAARATHAWCMRRAAAGPNRGSTANRLQSARRSITSASAGRSSGVPRRMRTSVSRCSITSVGRYVNIRPASTKRHPPCWTTTVVVGGSGDSEP